MADDNKPKEIPEDLVKVLQARQDQKLAEEKPLLESAITKLSPTFIDIIKAEIKYTKERPHAKDSEANKIELTSDGNGTTISKHTNEIEMFTKQDPKPLDLAVAKLSKEEFIVLLGKGPKDVLETEAFDTLKNQTEELIQKEGMNINGSKYITQSLSEFVGRACIKSTNAVYEQRDKGFIPQAISSAPVKPSELTPPPPLEKQK